MTKANGNAGSCLDMCNNGAWLNWLAKYNNILFQLHLVVRFIFLN